MSRTASTSRFSGDTRERHPSLILHVVGLSTAVSGVGVLVAGVVELIDGGSEVVPLLLCGAAITAVMNGERTLDDFAANICAEAAAAFEG